MEEKEKTPEDTSNDKGDVSDEYFDKDDEGILEHAINAGLLNDNDRQMFRESIERVQRTPISSRVVVERRGMKSVLPKKRTKQLLNKR